MNMEDMSKITDDLLNDIAKEIGVDEGEEDLSTEYSEEVEFFIDEDDEEEFENNYIKVNLDDRVDQLLNLSKEIDKFEVTQEYSEKYKGVNKRVIKDLQVFTEVHKEMLNSERVIQDSKELEKYRRFPKDTLVKRGIIYSEGIETVKLFPKLRFSSFTETINDAFNERYLLPIKLPNGDVFTFMGYDPQDEYNKYQVPKISTEPKDNWIRQGRMMGNLDSLERYPRGTDIFVVEGYFDAVHMEEVFKRPVIATLGANVRGGKLSLLYQIKKEYNAKLILVPDFDHTGMEESHIRKDVWDSIYNYNYGRSKDAIYKDIDDFLIETAKDKIPPIDLLTT